jgi:hypothetical protein
MSHQPTTIALPQTAQAERPETVPPHPIAYAIDRYLQSTLDIKFAERTFVPAAGAMIKRQYTDMKAEFKDADALMEDTDGGKRAHGLKRAFSAMRKARRLQHSRLPQQLESSLFVSLFSAFDIFTGELLSALHMKKPALFDRLNRSVPLSIVLAASSIDMLKASVLDEEIESFRRKSYAEQFEYLESAFKVELRKFPKWPDFIEAGQRRNLFTHCGGFVSDQYRLACQKEGYPSQKLSPLGTKLELGSKYFLPTCELMLEVGLKLGQTLWRKVLPDDLEAADTHLNSVVYEALSLQRWERAEIIGEFFANQKHLSSDLKRRMATVNYAIALKHMDKADEMRAALLRHDWSASIPEFRLAVSVLFGRNAEAYELMRAIGPKGQLIDEHAYHAWPLFFDVRAEPEFHQAYEAVYGYQFVSKVQVATREERTALEQKTADMEIDSPILEQAEASHPLYTAAAGDDLTSSPLLETPVPVSACPQASTDSPAPTT